MPTCIYCGNTTSDQSDFIQMGNVEAMKASGVKYKEQLICKDGCACQTFVPSWRGYFGASILFELVLLLAVGAVILLFDHKLTGVFTVTLGESVWIPKAVVYGLLSVIPSLMLVRGGVLAPINVVLLLILSYNLIV